MMALVTLPDGDKEFLDLGEPVWEGKVEIYNPPTGCDLILYALYAGNTSKRIVGEFKLSVPRTDDTGRSLVEANRVYRELNRSWLMDQVYLEKLAPVIGALFPPKPL